MVVMAVGFFQDNFVNLSTMVDRVQSGQYWFAVWFPPRFTEVLLTSIIVGTEYWGRCRY